MIESCVKVLELVEAAKRFWVDITTILRTTDAQISSERQICRTILVGMKQIADSLGRSP
jgi:hypothetical protein